MAKLYPPYIEGVLPAFCLKTKIFSEKEEYEEGDIVQKDDKYLIYVKDENQENSYYWEQISEEQGRNGGDGKIVIPFANNKAVSIADIGGMAIKVKSVQNDVLIDDFSVPLENINFDDNTITLKISNGKLTLNDSVWDIVIQRYWKLQIAYKDKNNNVGYYSTVGVIKCTSKPTVYIEGFEENAINSNNNEFIGVYRQEAGGDITEKVYSSEFIITDIQGNVVATSGEILHNVENNPNSYESHDIMTFNRDLEFGEIYEIVYNIKTNNGLPFSSPRYKLTQQKSLNMELKGKLVAETNYDDGYVDIRIEGYVDPDTKKEEIGLGAFVLTREDALNPGYWNELYRFTLNYESPTKTIFRDFTVEQGKTYTYSIQQYNAKRIYSSRRKSNSVIVDFEDMFLFDGERQLKLRFNPQVSSFKTQLAESKTDTIGSKYPFFFRNARVGYKTFPISGLISMLTDDNQFFIKYDDILREDFTADRHNVNTNKKIMPRTYPHTDLIAENFVSERLFKLEVLDWINNGKVKLFRSPGEGNYLVRLMDNSLTPQVSLGRMLHTLNGTAYECAENIHSNLVQYGIIKDNSEDDNVITGQVLITNWNELRLDDPIIQDLAIRLREEKNSSSMDENAMGASNDVEEEAKNSALFQALLLTGTPPHSKNLIMTDMGESAYTTHLRFEDVMPGTKFRLVFSQPASFDSDNYLDIIIGSTGAYYADDIEKVYGIYYIGEYNNIPDPSNPAVIKIGDEYAYLPASGSGTITYEHETVARSSNMFDSVEDIRTDIGAYAQLVGEKKVIESLTNTKEQVTQIAMSNYFKRPIEYLYYASEEIPNIISGENIYETGYNIHGYRNLKENKYKYKLFWDLPNGGLSAYEQRVEELKMLFKKTPNTNGLPEEWWDVQDWADYYAKVNMLQQGVNPTKVSQEDYWQYYPMNWLMYYKSKDSSLPTRDEVASYIGGAGGTGTIQMIIQKGDGSWTSHGPSCSHSFFQFIPNFKVLDDNGNVKTYHDKEHNIDIKMQTLSGITENTKVYIYNPTFPGEVKYQVISETGEITLDLSQYLGREMGAEYFDDQENMEYSPFSLYVLQSDILNIDGVQQSIFAHLPANDSIEEKTHITNHMFEKYYIDRYLKAKSAEEMLTERSLLAKRLNSSDDSDSTIVSESTSLYVLDPWYGRIYEVGNYYLYDSNIEINTNIIENWKEWINEAAQEHKKYAIGDYVKYNNLIFKSLKDENTDKPQTTANWIIVGEKFYYNPSITYRNNNIDLREIQRYSLDNLDPEDGDIIIGNGTYGDIFYQKVTLVYNIEEQLDINYDNIYAHTREIMKTENGITSYVNYITEKQNADMIKNSYNQQLQSIINNWTKKQS